MEAIPAMDPESPTYPNGSLEAYLIASFQHASFHWNGWRGWFHSPWTTVYNRLRGYLNQAKAARVSIVEVRKWWIASDSDNIGCFRL